MGPSEADYQQAVAAVQRGDLLGLPTETVYGLAADASKPAAVAKIFAAKGRPADHPLIVHIAGAEGMAHWAAEIPEAAKSLAQAFWPGPLTLILKKQAWVPDAVTGGQETVGLRVPAHPVALELLNRLIAQNTSAGIAAPSANRFGRISPTTAQHVRDELGDAVAVVLDGGPCEVGIESTIVDVSRGTPVILRPGQLTPAILATVLGFEPVIELTKTGGAPRVSGSLESHYAPETRLYLLDTDPLLNYLNVVRHRGGRCGVIAHDLPKMVAQPHEWRMLPADPEGYAREIYAALRDLDALQLDAIVVQSLPRSADWIAVADRLKRAAA